MCSSIWNRTTVTCCYGMLTLLVLVYSYIMISEASFKNCSIKPVNRCQNLTRESTFWDTYLKATFKNLFSMEKWNIQNQSINIFSLPKGILWHGRFFCLLFPIYYGCHHPMVMTWNTCTTEIISMSGIKKHIICYDLFYLHYWYSAHFLFCVKNSHIAIESLHHFK